MKKILKFLVLNLFALHIVNYLFNNLVLPGEFKQQVIIAGILTLFELLLKPILNILLLPINLLTFGLVRTLINTLGLYLAVFLVDGFAVNTFTIPTLTIAGFTLPTLSFYGFFAYVLTSLAMHIFISFLNNLFTRKIK